MGTAVSLVQREGRWQIMLAYDNGSYSLSRKIYATENEAKQAALAWVLEHHIPEGKAN